MYKIVLLHLISGLLCFGSLAQNSWQKTYNTTSTQGRAIQTQDGGFASISEVSSAPTAGGSDIALTKYDADGNVQWSKIYGSSANEVGKCIIQAADGSFYMAGLIGGTMVIIKTDVNGNLLWQKGGNGIPHTLSINSSNELVLGWSRVSGGFYYSSIIKYDAAGTPTFSYMLNQNTGIDVSNGVGQQTSDGGYVLGGNRAGNTVIARLNPGGGLVWTKHYYGLTGNTNLKTIQQLQDGSFIISGSTTSFGFGNSDAFLMKLSNDGNVIWFKTYGDSEANTGNFVKPTSDGGFILTGNTTTGTNTDVFAIKTNSFGEIEWSKRYDLGGNENSGSVEQTSEGGYLLCSRDQSNDCWLLRTDINGAAGNCSASTFQATSFSFAPIELSLSYLSATTTANNTTSLIANPRTVTTTSVCSTPFCNVNSSFTYSPTTISVGSSMNLTNTSSNGLSYEWLNNGTLFSTATNPTFSPTSTGTNTIVLRAIGAQCTDTIAIPITITPALSGVSWQKTYSTLSSQGRIIQTIDGGFASLTETASSLTAGGNDMALTKYDADGNVQWCRLYGSSFEELGKCLIQDAGGSYYLAGVQGGVMVIIKTGASGDIVWQRTGTGYPNSLSFNSSGELVIGCSMISGGYFYSCVVKYNSSGTATLMYRLNQNTTLDVTNGPAQQTADGGYILGGNRGNNTVISKLNSGAGLVWTKHIYGAAGSTNLKTIQQLPDGAHIVCGSTSAFGFGNSDAFLMKISDVGDVLWFKVYGDTENNFGMFARPTSDGGFILTGNTATGTNTDVFLIKLNSTGDIVWSKRYDQGGNEEVYSVEQTSNGGYILSAKNQSNACWIIRTDASGDAGNCGTTYTASSFSFSPTVLSVAYLNSTTSNSTINLTANYKSVTTTTQCFVSNCSAPTMPSSISGSTTVCSGSSQTYFVMNDPAATSYTWTFPGGWSGTSTTNSITATIGASGGTISVVANNDCGSSSAQTITISVNSAPATPGTISGNTAVCSGSSQTYSVMNDPAATSYTWTLPVGWSGTSTTNSITATAGASGGTISVIANNGCGSSSAQTLTISVNSIPATPGTISGSSAVCSGSSQTYSVTNNPAATSYTWTFPSGWSGTSTTNSITATAGASGGTISVVANNGCGSSSAQTSSIIVNSTPATPSLISGSTTICSGSSQTYSVTNNPAATSYTWTLPGGWSGTSTTNSITATVGTSGGTISVVANNACGSSSPQTLSMTVSTAPATPGTISGSASVCSGTSQTYSVTNDPSATSYTWNIPAAWGPNSTTNSITLTPGPSNGTISVVANNSCGSSTAQTLFVNVNSSPSISGSIIGGTNICSGASQTYSTSNDPSVISYTWSLPSGWSGTSTTNSITATAGATGGTISVVANNGCGSSSAQNLSISVNSVPATPAVISGSTTVCSGTSQTYSVTNDPAVTSYTWTLPGSWSGTSTTNSITATAGASGGTISVIANNGCGSSSAQTLTITVNSAPSTPSVISGSTTICSGSSQTYSVTNNPAATSYTWTLPGGWSGTSTTNSITATSSASSGTVSVIANNGCGSSTSQSLIVGVETIPNPPSLISGDDNVCEGSLQSYSVTLDPLVTTYNWTLPAGSTGLSFTNSIDVTIGSTSGSIIVDATNNCGTSSAQFMNILVNELPNVSWVLDPSTICLQNGLSPLSVGSPSGGAYAGSGVVETNFDPTVTGAGTFQLTYSYTDVNGCSNSVDQNLTVEDCASISSIDQDYFILYPNPFKDVLTIQFENDDERLIELLSITGQIISSSKFNGNKVQIAEEGLESGVYYIRINHERLTKVIKL